MLPILIVDDSSEDLALAQRTLTGVKILNPILLINGGRKCLDYFAGEGGFQDRQLPVLLLLDLSMPDVDGTAVLSKLSARPPTGTVFVMLSGVGDLRLVQKGYQLGAVTFLMKPLSESDVLEMLDKVKGIKLRQRRQGIEIQLEKTERLFPV